MINLNNKKEVIKYIADFEQEIAKLHSQEKIPYPIHLDGSQDKKLEHKLIKFFKKNKINSNTWILTTHRSHIPWLLSGRNPKELKQQILDGNSMAVFGNKFFTSSIVGGNLPIALGIAQALKMENSKEKVFCFCGDMSASGGLFQECLQYAKGHNSPIVYIVLDNEFSVRAKTCLTWGCKKGKNKTIKIKYKRIYGHAGSKLETENCSSMF